jgi:transposase
LVRGINTNLGLPFPIIYAIIFIHIFELEVKKTMSLKFPDHWTEELLEQYYQHAENPFAAKRYHALLLCFRAYQRQEVAEIVGVSSRTLQYWINQAIKEGLDSLGRPKHGGGNPGKLSFQQQATVDRWVEEQPTITLQRLQNRILACWDISLSLPQLSALLKQLGYRRVVPRKRHYQADLTSQGAYKKKLPTGLLTLKEVSITSYLVMRHGLV